MERWNDLSFRGLIFLFSDGASLFLGSSPNISEPIQMLSPILVGWAPPFGEMCDWLQFAYTTDRTGSYVAPASVVLAQSPVTEGDPIFPAIWRHLLCYSGAYTPPTSTIGPPGPEYSDFSPIGRVPERRDLDTVGEGGIGDVLVHIYIFCLGYQTKVLGLMNNPSINVKHQFMALFWRLFVF